MAIAQFQNIPIIFRLKIRVKFQIHGKIYKRTEKIFFRVFGNTRKKKKFRVFPNARKKFPCIQKFSVHSKNFRVFTNTRKFFPCIQKNSVYLKNFRVLISIHGKHRPGEQTLN